MLHCMREMELFIYRAMKSKVNSILQCLLVHYIRFAIKIIIKIGIILFYKKNFVAMKSLP